MFRAVDIICRTYSLRPSDILDPYHQLNPFERISLDLSVLMSASDDEEYQEFDEEVKNEIIRR